MPPTRPVDAEDWRTGDSVRPAPTQARRAQDFARAQDKIEARARRACRVRGLPTISRTASPGGRAVGCRAGISGRGQSSCGSIHIVLVLGRLAPTLRPRRRRAAPRPGRRGAQDLDQAVRDEDHGDAARFPSLARRSPLRTRRPGGVRLEVGSSMITMRAPRQQGLGDLDEAGGGCRASDSGAIGV